MDDLPILLKENAVMIGCYELTVDDKEVLLRFARALIKDSKIRTEPAT